MKSINKYFIYLGVLIFFSPLGLFLPKWFGAESAWGEWNNEEINKLIGYIPVGISKFSVIWHPLFPNYNFVNNNVIDKNLAYIFCGYAGALACILFVFLWIKLSKKCFK